MGCHVSFRKSLFKGARSFACIKRVAAVGRQMQRSLRTLPRANPCVCCSPGMCCNYPTPALVLAMAPENMVLDHCRLHRSPVGAASTAWGLANAAKQVRFRVGPVATHLPAHYCHQQTQTEERKKIESRSSKNVTHSLCPVPQLVRS